MEGVRFRDDTGFEGRCEYCRSWWPIDREFWYPKHGLRRCKACWAMYHREHEAGRRKDDIVAEMKRQRSRERYHMNKVRHLAKTAEWKRANREHVAAYNREYRARRRGYSPGVSGDGDDGRDRAPDNQGVSQLNIGGAPVTLHAETAA